MTKKTLQQIIDEERSKSELSKKTIKAINTTHQNDDRKHDLEYQQKFKDLMASDEYRQKVRAATQTPEFKKLKSEQSKKLWQDPEYREKQLKILSSPEVKRKQSAAALRREANPEFAKKKKEKLKKTYSDPERNKLISERQKQVWQDKDRRKDMSEKQKIIANNRSKEEWDDIHNTRLKNGWADKIKEAGKRKRKSIVAGGIPFESRIDAIKYYKFDPAMIQYNMKHHPDTWYYISKEEYEKLTKK